MAEKREIPGKLPPQNTEVEQSLLGALLLDGNSIDRATPIVRSTDFYDPKHKKIYDVMIELNKKGDSIDSLTVTEGLRLRGWLESVGGASYVSSLSDTVPTSAHVEDYAHIVRDKSILRNLIELSTGIIEDSFKESDTPENILQDAESKIFSIAERNQKSSMVAVRDIISDVWENIKIRGKNPDALTGLETGFKKIDDYTSGLQSGELIIIAARPSLGKTSLALNIAYNLAVKKQKNILIFSLEMNADDLLKRFLAVGSSVSMQKLRTGKYITREEDSRLMHTAGELSNTNIVIDADDNDVFNMRAKARTLELRLIKDGKKLDMVVVDYMQLVKPNERIPSRERQIAEISRSLKGMARELKIPVVALSQLNREPEKRERSSGKGGSKVAPRLSDLRESGAIEQDADIVMFIDREEDEEVDRETTDGTRTKTRKCRFIIAKNRNGPMGEQKVYFLPDFTKFVEYDSRESDEDFDAGARDEGAFQ